MKRSTYIVLSVLVLLSLVLSACQPAATGTGGTKVRVATEAAYPPFEMINDETKDFEGFDIDLMRAIAKKAGFEVEFQNTPFDALQTAIATCQVDVAISAITITEERKQKWLFSEPYINAGQIVAVRTDSAVTGPQDLKNMTIGVQASTTGEIEAKKIEGATVKPYDAVDLAFLDLQNKQVDAVIVDYPTTFTYIAKAPDKIKTVGEPFTDESYGIAICNKKADLQKQINDALAALKADGTLKSLEDKWLGGK